MTIARGDSREIRATQVTSIFPKESAHPATAVSTLLRHLKKEGVRFVFGIPGGLLHPFFQAIEDDPDFQLIVSKHESGAGFMADGCYRGGGGLAAVAATSGPGATNLITAVSVAHADGIPMLVITGQAATAALGKGAAQETPPEDIDIVGMFRPVTKYSTMVTSAGKLSHHFRRALRAALTGRPGPVHLNVPVDLWHQPVHGDWFDPLTYRPPSALFDRASSRRGGAYAALGALPAAARRLGRPGGSSAPTPAPCSSTARTHGSRPLRGPRGCFPRTTRPRSACSGSPGTRTPGRRCSGPRSTCS